MRSKLGSRALAGALLGVLVLGGCGGTSSDGADESSSLAPSAPSEVETGTPSPSPAEPTVPLASGKVLEQELVRLRAPRGWELDDSMPSLQFAYGPHDEVSVVLSVQEDGYAQTYGAPVSLARSARIAKGERMRLLEPVELGGVEFFHVSGPNGSFWYEIFGTSHEEMRVQVELEFSLGYPRRKRERILASVLPTLEWF